MGVVFDNFGDNNILATSIVALCPDGEIGSHVRIKI